MRNEENKEYTKRYITQALFQLMKNYDYEKITIMDIVKKAGVGRVTYYRNFASKDDIIIQYFDSQISNYKARVFFLPRTKDDYKEIIRQVFTMFYEKKDILILLLKAKMQNIYLDYLNKNFVLLFRKQQHDDKYSPYVYAGALFNISMAWLANDCKDSIEDVTNALFNAIINPTI